jgi:hypothetical protein
VDTLSLANVRRFFQLSLEEESGILYQDDKIEVHWLQSFPYINDDFYHHAERGLLAGRVDLKLFSKGFESIHLKCTNNDVKGLKVVPLPISAAASNSVGPPQIIIQTICVELIEMLEAHPFVKCDLTLLNTGPGDGGGFGENTRDEHNCVFALPIVMLKFCLPWEVTENEFDTFNNSIPVAKRASVATPSPDVVSVDFPEHVLTFGHIFHIVSRSPGKVVMGATLVKHGETKRDLNIALVMDAQKIEVRTEEKRLSNITVETLKQFYDFAIKDLGAFAEGANVIPAGAASMKGGQSDADAMTAAGMGR